MKDLNIDIDNGWLDDIVIDCAQNLIHSQFPNKDGLQSCCYAQKPCFRPTTDTFIQILNTHPKGGGLHWVSVSTYENPVSGAVKLYDSILALGVSTSIEMSVSNMLVPLKVQHIFIGVFLASKGCITKTGPYTVIFH